VLAAQNDNFVKGESELNRLITNRGGGFTLIELIIAVAMITIILTMAVPTYSNYLIRAKIDRSLSVVSPAKTSIIDICQKNPTITRLSNQVLGLHFEATKHIFNLEIGGDCDAPTITITTQATGAQPDPVLTITGDFAGNTRRITWLCVSDGLEIHLPESCRCSPNPCP
jgi:prepilin-type N-terminal cleavage/methylation domain-containing protein